MIGPDNDDDQNSDSLMVPVASAFVELYHPEYSVTDQIPAAELDSTQTGIDLAQRDPNNNPVFRLQIVQGTGVGFNPFDPMVDPDYAPNGMLNVSRYIYFNEPVPASLNDEGIVDTTVFATNFDNVGNTIVAPGEFAMIGSQGVEFNGHDTTFLGRRQGVVFDETGVPNAGALQLDQTRRIELRTADREILVFDSADPNNATTAQNVTILPFNGPVSLAAADRQSVGFSDPHLGYGQINEGGGEMLDVNYGGPDGPYFEFNNAPATADQPADLQAAGRPGHVGTIAGENGLWNSQYVVLLQRLADPTRAFDPQSNPYLTMDSSSTDLFVFNGLNTSDEDEIPDLTNDPGPDYFGSYERRSDRTDAEMGQANSNDVEGTRFRMLFKTEFQGLKPMTESQNNPDSVDHILAKDLIHSLGVMNRAYFDGPNMANSDPANDRHNSPFAWLTWNNRPFYSPYELTLVPFGSNYSITSQFDVSLQSAGMMNDVFSPYVMSQAHMNNQQAVRGTILSGDFPHLLNFHNDGDNSPLLHRIFDFVEVPSPYVGTRTYLNPDSFVNPGSFTGAAGTTQLTRNFAPPFDYVSSFRYPGKVNINTISDFRVWNAIHGSYAWPDPRLNQDMDGVFDEHFERYQRMNFRPNPFKPHTAQNHVAAGMDIPGSRAGLFRRRGVGAMSPLFDYDPSLNLGQDSFPLAIADRNAYFKYHPRNRIGNLVTNRSSVFAIWISVRYFPVNAMDDGNGVVQDVIANAPYTDPNTGQVETSRAFFIVDRSIPVAFEPGKDHNVERAIRISTYIENENLVN